jgi:hypothetical protein
VDYFDGPGGDLLLYIVIVWQKIVSSCSLRIDMFGEVLFLDPVNDIVLGKLLCLEFSPQLKILLLYG